MRVAIVHYWLVGMRGGEKVVEALCRLYPQADIFTHVVVPAAISDEIVRHNITTSFISRLPSPRRFYKRYLPLMPLALEQLDLRGYDLIISSEAGPAKGIIPAPHALHVCYCHSPMRYIWNMYHEYRDDAGALTRMFMPFIAHYLRNWDVTSQARVHEYIANSSCVADRIKTYYNRPAAVIHPPVAVQDFQPIDEQNVEDFYLVAGELVSYKRVDLAIRAFNRMKRRLVVIGGGENLQRYRKLAGPTVSVMGSQPFNVLRWHYAHCRALVYPGEEDFGIVPVEAMASGRPVIAFNRGGARETVIPYQSGLLFDEQTVECLIAAIEQCEVTTFIPQRIAASAQKFNEERFANSFRVFVDHKIDMKKRSEGLASSEDLFDAMRSGSRSREVSPVPIRTGSPALF